MTVDADRVRAANYAYLLAALDALYARVRDEPPADEKAVAIAAEELGGPSALDVLAETFGLAAFERDVVLLCTGFEIDARFGADCGVPTVGLAFAVLAGASWTAFQEAAPLRRWGIVDVSDDGPLVAAPLRLSRDVLGFVLGQGVPGDDDTVRAVDVPDDPPPSQAAVAEAAFGAVRGLLAARDAMAAVELRGAAADERRAVAALVARSLGTDLYAVDARDLPPPGPDLARLLRDWNRRAVLAERCLLVEVEDETDPAERDRVRAVLALAPGAVVVSARTGVVGDVPRPVVRHDVPWPEAGERLDVWRAAFASATGAPPGDDGDLRALADEYRLGAAAVAAVCAEAAASGDAYAALREACRRRTRARLDAVADRVDTAGAPRLVLPDRVRAEVDELARHVAAAHLVRPLWGGGHGMPGVAAMFSGPSGTGKTLAAIDVARRAGLDLYRVDLSSLVSKYIGETEKNIRTAFDAADLGGVVLLFDEADALFGARTETRDSHDRYANLEVAYLLQRIELARAPTILTTNLAESVDPAFLRRLRFVVEFPFPDEAARAEMWAAVFPEGTPTEGLDRAKLARLSVNGAAIRDIALRATFGAVAEGRAVTMRDLLDAARAELRKAARDLPATEVEGWT